MKNEITFETETKTRWMIVDDDAAVLTQLSAFVAQLMGAEIVCFRSAKAALMAFAEAPEKFQFVITDLEMPGLDGINFCRRLRAISPGVKVLLSTGSRILTTAEAVQIGFCGLLIKPFPAAAIKKALVVAGIFNSAREKFSGVLMPA
jgi:DNA-binding NtrC family response regulator